MNVGHLLRTHWDRAAAIGCGAAAVIALTVGWLRLTGTPYVAEQLSFLLSGGIGAVLLLGAGATLWLSADLHDEWRQLDSIDEALRELRGTALTRPVTAEATAAQDVPADAAMLPGGRQ